MAHSLDAAVAAGIITEEAAFCGLTPRMVAQIDEAGHGEANLLVRVRSPYGDGRAIVPVSAIARAQEEGPDTMLDAISGWRYSDIRDITAVPA